MNELEKIYIEIKRIMASDSFLGIVSSGTVHSCDALIRQSLHEAQWAIEFLSRYDVKGKVILEIGAGAGIVSACLHLAGARIAMVEPSAGVFSYQEKISAVLHAYLAVSIPVINKPVEEIKPEGERYDFIFSVNVLEHIMNLPKAFNVMSRLLKNDGVMFHVCPNYYIPYEPHAGGALVPFFPAISLRISKKLQSHPVADMLNFITVGTIKKLAKANNLTVHFDAGMMYKTFMRLQYDSEFKKRQSGLPLRVFQLLELLKIVGVTKYVPVCLQTPVAFEMRKK